MSASARLRRDVCESLRSQPGRIGLSFLAVMIGIVALTLLLAMLQGLRHEARRMITAFGANVVAALPESEAALRGGYRGLEAWSDYLSANLTPARTALMIRLGVAASDWHDTPVWAGGHALMEVRGWSLAEGRMFDALDEANGSRVAVITEALRRSAGVGIGGSFPIGSHAFTVVGVLREGGGVPSGNVRAAGGEALVLIPSAVAARNEMPFDPATAALFIRLPGENDWREAIARADALLQDPAWAGWPARWITPESLLRGIREWQRVVGLAAGSIALLCLLLGGTTLMSLMLAEVRQRVPEIGLRRSLGATRRDIAMLFVAESIVITGAAAIAGMTVAGLLLAALSGQSAVPLGVNYFTFVIPVIVSIVIGGAFSFWPARLAAGLSPALALRNA